MFIFDNIEFYPTTENNVEIVAPTAADSTNEDAVAVNGEANHDTDASDNEKANNFYKIVFEDFSLLFQ